MVKQKLYCHQIGQALDSLFPALTAWALTILAVNLSCGLARVVQFPLENVEILLFQFHSTRSVGWQRVNPKVAA